MGRNRFSFWHDRLQAAGVHLLISAAIAALAAWLVFGVWYPYPYREISGGRELFLIVISVDVILGPLITLTIFNRQKPWSLLRRDLATVAIIQLAALAYGMWTVFVARPVHLVFEYSRFTVVHAVDVPPALLSKAAPGLDVMPLSGPTLLSLRPFKDEQERTDALFAELGGTSVATRPDLWQPYTAALAEIHKNAKPLTALRARLPAHSADIDRAVAASGRDIERLIYLPMIGRKTFWTVLLDGSTAGVVGYLPLDSF